MINIDTIKNKVNEKKQYISNLKSKMDLKQKYITGMTAFNIPYKGNICSWHQSEMLKRDKYITHPDNIIGAEIIFKEYGLYDVNDFFIRNNKDIKKITGTSLCATPIRAILDLLFFYVVVKNKYPNPLKNFYKDYMFEEINMNELIVKIDILNENLDIEKKSILNQWMLDNEIRYLK